MKEIHIPPAALEAGARAICARYCFDADHLAPKLRLDGGIDHVPYWTVYEDTARAAFLAMVEAWPGMEPHKVLSVRDNGEGYDLKRIGFILPLPQEKPNE